MQFVKQVSEEEEWEVKVENFLQWFSQFGKPNLDIKFQKN